jgi:hypothetical protein
MVLIDGLKDDLRLLIEEFRGYGPLDDDLIAIGWIGHAGVGGPDMGAGQVIRVDRDLPE